jgi:CBS domain containing-hemolysin-like protein
MTAVLLLAAVLLVVGNALFVAAELAAVSVRRAQLEPLAANSRRARRVLAAQQRLSLLLAGAQLGVTLCSLGLGAVAEPTVAAVFEHALHAAHLPVQIADPIAFGVALALVVLAHMVIGEMASATPSTCATRRRPAPRPSFAARVRGHVLRFHAPHRQDHPRPARPGRSGTSPATPSLGR